MSAVNQVDESPVRRPTRAPAGDEAAWRGFAEAATVEAFYRGWLGVQCGLIAGVDAAAVFGVNSSGVLLPAPLAVWGDADHALASLTEGSQGALGRRGRIISQCRLESSRRWIVAFPVQAQGQVVGAVALDLVPRPQEELERALRQLEWGAGWLEALALRQTTGAERPAASERLQAVLDLVASAQEHEGFIEAATAFVTELATKLACDRVSIGFVRAGRARVRAMSHTAHVASRTNLIRAIGAAMDEAIDQKAPVAVPPPPGAAPCVRRAHDDLAREGNAGSVCTVPFACGSRIVGALTLERSAGRPFDARTLDLVEAVAGLAGPALEVLRREDRWLAVKAADAARRTAARLVGPGHLALKLGVVAVTAVAAVLCFATGDYRVVARAGMEAREQRAAVAPFRGYLREAPARAGDVVRQGQMLAVLDDRELRLERARLESQGDQLERQRALALAQGNAAQINIARAQIEQTAARIALVDQQLGKTRVVAGFDGVVVSGDLTQSLGSPVDRGQVLFELAPLHAYRLVLQVDERDIGEVVRGQRGHLLLAATPHDAAAFTVEKILPVATARDGRNYFRVEARLDRAPEGLRPGMEGVAKIAVDERLLVTIWTRSALDWAHLALWTWWP